MARSDEITEMLKLLRQGDRSIEDQLLDLVYPELHRLAVYYWRNERSGHTLQPTALINEAYLVLINQWDKDWHNRAHFYGVAAMVMRRVLVDYARGHGCLKRGGNQEKVCLDDVQLFSPTQLESVIAIDQGLKRLAEWDPRQSKVVELRFFGGLTAEEAAEVLGTTARTVQRDWEMARAWLIGEINAGPA
jgi:RNA polymerase sigma-70 factor, ECF subfamily